MQLMINSFGASLRRQGDRFVVKAGPKRQAFSAAKVQSILVAMTSRLTRLPLYPRLGLSTGA